MAAEPVVAAKGVDQIIVELNKDAPPPGAEPAKEPAAADKK
jgi:hypothetical protein